ncbi:hypothetical protein A3D05_01450 [Candidatus Gottesmanbacteria bacterium RIFCSPHIGHO2_02_FULL_40_24]|nr:MAG: hypothetical protein A3D05_01450 [Candidatus Gottesmanbacteria bacterium RIFCSPHIGHO2_02_FULL_40_24]
MNPEILRQTLTPSEKIALNMQENSLADKVSKLIENRGQDINKHLMYSFTVLKEKFSSLSLQFSATDHALTWGLIGVGFGSVFGIASRLSDKGYVKYLLIPGVIAFETSGLFYGLSTQSSELTALSAGALLSTIATGPGPWIGRNLRYLLLEKEL